MGLETHVKVVRDRAGFLGNLFCHATKRPKQGFF